jgi:hypothetical protein
MFHRHPQPPSRDRDNHHLPRNIDRFKILYYFIPIINYKDYDEPAWVRAAERTAPSQFSIVGIPDQDPMHNSGYPRGGPGWVSTVFSYVSPLACSCFLLNPDKLENIGKYYLSSTY